ncbi:MAG: hypothetical protein IM574_06605 [Cytophagales bacterium]|nr:hypothetical protein [Cytophagales bacterium]MCA6412036.1 hypothetical protein [Cytophagales bacterium]MCA6426629.1 hypothetical protein [Cytophagales bacterium]MCA6429938.1 hypothetical protein [Cytophagales bacterium]MCA6433264.1 hypothetical protein [Cytophagales bacterium]
MKFEHWFFSNDGTQKKWFVVLGVFLPIILTVIFSVWGIKISIESANNREQIESLLLLVRESQKQVAVLQSIYEVSENTSESASKLKDLPEKIALLSSTLDSLNLTLSKETKRVSRSYGELNETYNSLIRQQKEYLEKISNVVDLTNQEIASLSRNNELIRNEFSRRSNISVFGVTHLDSLGLVLDAFIIQNSGELECQIEVADFEILNPGFKCEGRSNPNTNWDFQFIKQSNTYRLTNVNLHKNIVNVGRPLRLRFQNGCFLPQADYIVRYSITYVNKYESKTVFGNIKF